MVTGNEGFALLLLVNVTLGFDPHKSVVKSKNISSKLSFLSLNKVRTGQCDQIW